MEPWRSARLRLSSGGSDWLNSIKHTGIVFANPISQFSQFSQLFDSRNSILHVKCDISDMRALEHQPYSSIKHTGIVFANPISQSVVRF